eukprot:c17926_g1_i1.p1 GENE.c17926_g1_i1~~c17926_g1_i1.p1  ORF type:complete len:209 (+),score=50.49 c17926_g1_i1:1-627(+)
MGYNVFYTGLLACFYMLDLDLPTEVLMSDALQYQSLHPNRLLNWRTFFTWFARALYQAIAIFAVTTLTVANTVPQSAHAFGDEEISLIAFTSLIFVQIFTILLESNTVTSLNAIVLIGTLGLFYMLNVGFSLVGRLSMYGLMFHVAVEPGVLLSEILAIALCLLPVFAVRAHQVLFNPEIWQKTRSLVLKKKLIFASKSQGEIELPVL